MKKLRKRDWYLALSMFMVIAGYAVNVWLAYNDHQLPSEVNLGWFGFWTHEVFQIARIKINESKKESEDIQ